jgi:hypothetical protein
MQSENGAEYIYIHQQEAHPVYLHLDGVRPKPGTNQHRAGEWTVSGALLAPSAYCMQVRLVCLRDPKAPRRPWGRARN